MTSKYAGKIASVAVFSLALIVLLGGYLASYTSKNGLFLAAGIVFTIALAVAAAALWGE